MNILETKELQHSFGQLKVLFGVNLQIAEGERHAVIAPTAREKPHCSTPSGNLCPDSGRVFFKGKTLRAFRP
jgi:branched-chain amino acid transport system ATP-binding protein